MEYKAELNNDINQFSKALSFALVIYTLQKMTSLFFSMTITICLICFTCFILFIKRTNIPILTVLNLAFMNLQTILSPLTTKELYINTLFTMILIKFFRDAPYGSNVIDKTVHKSTLLIYFILYIIVNYIMHITTFIKIIMVIVTLYLLLQMLEDKFRVMEIHELEEYLDDMWMIGQYTSKTFLSQFVVLYLCMLFF
jgi:hypothetical protein